MKCTNCNAELGPSYQFCGQCGHPVPEPAVSPEVEVTMESTPQLEADPSSVPREPTGQVPFIPFENTLKTAFIRNAPLLLWISVIVYMVFAVSLLLFSTLSAPRFEQLPYSDFKVFLRQDRIEDVQITTHTIRVTLRPGTNEKAPPLRFMTVRVDDPDLVQELEAHNIKYTGQYDSDFSTSEAAEAEGYLSFGSALILVFGSWLFPQKKVRASRICGLAVFMQIIILLILILVVKPPGVVLPVHLLFAVWFCGIMMFYIRKENKPSAPHESS